MASPRPARRPFFEVFGFTRLFLLALSLVVLHLSTQLSLRELMGDGFSASLVSSLLLLVGFPWLIARMLGQSPRVTFRLFPLPARDLFLLTLITIAAIWPIDLITALNTRLLPPPVDLAETLRALRPTTLPKWIVAAAAAGLVGPLGEEIVFRGMLQQSAQRHMRSGEAVLLCAFLFAAIHLQPYYLLGLLSVGVLVGVIFLRTGNLSGAVYVHGLYNLFSLAALGWGDPEATTLVDTRVGLPLAFVGLAVTIWALRRLGSSASAESTWKTG